MDGLRDQKIPNSTIAPIPVRKERDALPCSAPAFVVEQWRRKRKRDTGLVSHAWPANWLAFAPGDDFGPPVITRHLPRIGMSMIGPTRMTAEWESATNRDLLISLLLELQVAAALSLRWIVKHAHACGRRQMDIARPWLRFHLANRLSKFPSASVTRLHYGYRE